MWWKVSFWFVGIGSTVWLLLRSGSKPKRLTYPCQRVAAANSLGFLGYLATVLGSSALLRRLRQSFSWGKLIALFALAVSAILLQSSVASPVLPAKAADISILPAWEKTGAISNVFAVTDVPAPQYSLDGGDIPTGVPASTALRDAGVDTLVSLMEAKGDYFYQTAAHPNGLFASDDVIVLKVNNQWDGRNGTNTDVVKGVIYRLVQHPEGFTGAVIIAENSQNHNDDWYIEPSGNNSQFQDQSYLEVTQAFAGEGYNVCIADWKGFWTTIVGDYDTGNNTNGYVLEDADGTATELGHGRLSYPKFQVNCGSMTNLRVSMKKGVWNGSSFDSSRLKMINMPVVKRHNSAWGTISVKNYLGFITTCTGTECSQDVPRWVSPGYKHCWIMGAMDNGTTCTSYTEEYGLVARQMAHIRRADLNIVDAIWVNPRDNAGYQGDARRQDIILASHDPFAVDYYTSEYVLYPLVSAYGATSTPYHAQASHEGGWFRTTLLSNVARLRAEGVTDTINISDSMTRQQELDQFNAYVAESGTPVGPPFESSSKKVSHTRVYGGEEITYTITLYEDSSATLAMTDTIPAALTYVPGSAAIEPAWKGPVQDSGSIRWSGMVTSELPVVITFRAQVPSTSATLAIVNQVKISRDGGTPIERQAVSILNPYSSFLPIVLKQSQ